MSQSATAAPKAGSSPAKPRDVSPQPVQINSSPSAQAIRHLQPVLLLATFLLRFNALVANPVSTMQTSLPVVAAIQVAYVVACLPPAGSQVGTVKKRRPGEKKRAENGPNAIAVRLSLGGPDVFFD